MWRFQDEISLVTIEGMPKVNEAVFIHKPSKTLIVVDLVLTLLKLTDLEHLLFSPSLEPIKNLG